MVDLLTEEEVSDLAAAGAMNGDIVRFRWPGYTDEQCAFVLWEHTEFPLCGTLAIIDTLAALPDDFLKTEASPPDSLTLRKVYP